MAATQQFNKRIISADSHVMEPLGLWWKALGHKFGDRTPRVLDEYRGQKGKFFYTGYQGQEVINLALFEPTPETEAALFSSFTNCVAKAARDLRCWVGV
jgi:hypothetical protein